MKKCIFWSSVILSFLWPFVCLGLAEDIRDVKPPVDLPPNYFFLFAVFLLSFLLIIGLAVCYFLRKFKKQKARPQIIKPPHVIAFERLEELRKKNLPAAGKIKEFYSELSDIIRRYIEDRFKIRAPEMTTQEFLWHLKDSGDLSSEHKTLLRDFLTSCDMVKFAKYGPSAAEIENSFERAKKFVEETKEELNPVTADKK